jgi:hypothetical protein
MGKDNHLTNLSFLRKACCNTVSPDVVQRRHRVSEDISRLVAFDAHFSQ